MSLTHWHNFPAALCANPTLYPLSAAAADLSEVDAVDGCDRKRGRREGVGGVARPPAPGRPRNQYRPFLERPPFPGHRLGFDNAQCVQGASSIRGVFRLQTSHHRSVIEGEVTPSYLRACADVRT